LFRFSVLYTALQAVLHDLESISDESAAVEKLGLKPLIVQSAERNIKITNDKDLQLAEFFLSKQS
jgi:2-C-methyl-D-erythritol 4-phosphate cytidylyltransferase